MAYNSITPFAKLEDCIAMKAKGYFTAGERDGKKVDGFDLGNSPFEYMEEKLKGKKIAFTTTNGTQAIAKADRSERNNHRILFESFCHYIASFGKR